MKIALEPPEKVTLSGHLDSKGAGQIYDELIEFCRSRTESVILNMGGVEGCTRAGSGVIFVAAKLLQQNGARLRIAHAPSAVINVISARGFQHLLTMEGCPSDGGKRFEQVNLRLSPRLEKRDQVYKHAS